MVVQIPRSLHGTYGNYTNNKCRCILCCEAKREYASKYNVENFTKIKQTRDTHRAENLKIINALKSNPCLDCGGLFPPECMDFDHLQDKSFDISTSLSRKLSTVLNEISKCELVCANCHRVRTHKRLISSDL